MLRLLGTDSGARQSLLESMELPDIASLQCTGRAWRGWIEEAPFVGAKELHIECDQSNNPSRCPWIRRSVHHLQFQDESSVFGKDSDDGEDPVLFDQLLLLPWSRLRSLKGTFYRSVPSVELLRASFASVAATLQRLDVTLYHSSAPAHSLLLSVHSLHQLESLTIAVKCDLTETDLSGLDLSPLHALPRLQRLTLRFMDRPPCSIAQVNTLAQCKSLTDLECGEWLPMRPSIDQLAHSVQLTDDQLQQIEDGIGRLCRLRKDNGAVPLRRLCLGSMPMILPPCWRVLSQFTALEELEGWWSCTLTAADWMLLSNFPRLHALTVTALEREDIGGVSRALLDVGLVLPALVRCRALRSLQLFGRLDLRTEHVALLAQIPSLESFAGQDLRIESLEPLTIAPALMELYLGYCADLNGEPVNIRAMIPAMPLVNKLTIADPWLSQMTAEEVETFNAALLARLPRLTPERLIEEHLFF